MQQVGLTEDTCNTEESYFWPLLPSVLSLVSCVVETSFLLEKRVKPTPTFKKHRSKLEKKILSKVVSILTQDFKKKSIEQKINELLKKKLVKMGSFSTGLVRDKLWIDKKKVKLM